MTDLELLLAALNDATKIISDHLKPPAGGEVKDAEVKLNRLILVLGDQNLTDAVDRLKARFGLRVVK